MKVSSLVKLICTMLLIAVIGFLAINGLQIGFYKLVPFADAIPRGLDLTGGMYAVYDAKDKNQADLDAKMSGAYGVLRNRLDASGYTEATISRTGARLRVEIPNVEDANAFLSIIGKPAKLEFRDPDKNVLFTGDSIQQAYVSYISGNKPVVSFKLNDEGAKIFADATAKYLGDTIEILLDGTVISAPTVQSVIPSGEGYIDGSSTLAEAQKLAMLIQSGALPLELEQIELRHISATLGDNALESSLLAGLIGIGVIFLFMLLYYRLPGLTADLSLLVYMLILFFLLAVVPGVQLTLPGIAGILLSIGMAVDANVIIFERFKEELHAGKTLRASVNAGFKNALRAIVDSNVTTLIAALVLYLFGSGPIKGFAITLGLGILTSMLTAIFVNRSILRWVVDLGIRNPKLYAFARKPKQEEAVQ